MLEQLIQYSAMLLAALGSVATMLFSVFLYRKMRVYDEMLFSLADLFRYEENEEGQPLIDARLQGLVGALGSSISQSLKMSFLGQLSGQARLEKGFKGAIAQDFLEKKAPIIKFISDIFGINAAEYAADNPDVIMQLLPMASQWLGAKGIGGFNSPKGKEASEGVFSIE